MKTERLTGAAIIFIVLLYACSAAAEDFSARLSANQNALDSEVTGMFTISDSKLMTGFSGVYDSDDYKILYASALISNEIFIDGLTGGLGFKGAWGKAEKRFIDGDVLNLGFALYASYDLTKSGLTDFPVVLSSSICLSPEPLSFEDTTELVEFLAECSWKVLDQAAVVVNYRYLEIDFDNQRKWQKNDSTGYIGIKFFF